MGLGGSLCVDIYLPPISLSSRSSLSLYLSLSLRHSLTVFPQCLILPEAHNCCRRTSLISLSLEFASIRLSHAILCPAKWNPNLLISPKAHGSASAAHPSTRLVLISPKAHGSTSAAHPAASDLQLRPQFFR